MKYKNAISWILRAGLIFVFLYAAIFMTLTPEKYIGYFPSFMQHILPGFTILHYFAFFEVFLCAWLIFGRRLSYAGLLAVGLLAGINIFNLDKFSVLFRNVAIICAALALVLLHKDDEDTAFIPGQKKEEPSKEPTLIATSPKASPMSQPTQTTISGSTLVPNPNLPRHNPPTSP